MRKISFAFFITSLVLSIPSFSSSDSSLKELLLSFHLNLKTAKEWKIVKKNEVSIEGKNRVSLVAENEASDQLHISILDGVTETEFKDIYKNDFLNIKNLYKENVTPYAGSISNMSGCSKQFLPQEGRIKTKSLVFQTLAAMTTGRLSYGICSEDLIFYDVLIGASFYDQKKYLKVSVYTRHKKKTTQYEKLKHQLALFEYEK